MSDERSFPDITFVDADTSATADEMIKQYEQLTGRSLYPADPVRLLLNYAATVISQERAIINDSARMNMPRFARGEYLDSLCEIFRDVSRLQAQPAQCTVKFTISEIRPDDIIVPSGTRITPDGTLMFATAEDIVISAGNISGTVKAVCETPGTVGNGFLAGQIKSCVDLFPYFGSVTNTDTSGGGSDTESDEALYERMRTSVEAYTTAGPSGAYIYHAKSASALISDVTASSPSAGVVDIRVLCDGGTMPTTELLGIVSDALNDDRIRPLTDSVVVSAPTAISFDVDITYYVESGSGMSLTAAAEAVEKAVDEYTTWQTAKIGRDINPSYLISLVMKSGIKRVEVASPVFTQVSDTQAAQLGSKTINAGGYESE